MLLIAPGINHAFFDRVPPLDRGFEAEPDAGRVSTRT
jgi:hypothetical protein